MDERKKNDLPDTERIKSDALRLLSFKPRSVAELKERLRAKRYEPALIEEVLEVLTRQGLLDDAKFARLYANSKVSMKPVSKKKLEIELSRKGIGGQALKQALGDLEEYDEKKAAKELVYGRFQRMKDLPAEKIKTRLFGFLKRRGFSNDVIFSVLRDLMKSEDPEEF